MKKKQTQKGFTKTMKTKYELSDKKASPFGGLHAISELFYSIGFDDLFVKTFKTLRRKRKYAPVDNLKTLVSLILAGGEKLSDIDIYHSDPVLPHLFGNGDVPQDTTLRRDLQLLGAHPKQRAELLFHLCDILLEHSGHRSITLDIDGTGTVTHGHQENAKKGYFPGQKNQSGHQHILVSWDKMNIPVYIETRAGNVHCSKDATEIMEEVLEHFENRVDSILVRADCGFYDKKLLDLLDSYPKVKYVIKASKVEAIVPKTNDVDYRPYSRSFHEYAKLGHTITGSVERQYIIERKLHGDRNNLYPELNYSYEVIVSNIENKLPYKIFITYNHRARQEKLICELKNDFALGKIVSGKFEITAASAWVSALSACVIAIFRNVALRRKHRQYRMKRLRFYFFNAVAVFIKRSRTRVLRIFSPPIGEWRYNQVIRRIHALA